MRKNAREAIYCWWNGLMCVKADSIWTDGVSIFSYKTCIATWESDKTFGKAILNMTKYSATTSGKQQDVLSFLDVTLKDARIVTVSNMRYGATREELLEAANTDAARTKHA